MQRPAQTGETYLTQAFRQFAEMSGDLCALREAEYPFRLIWANPAYYDAYRRAGKQVRTGQPWTDLLTGARREDALRAMRQVAETGETYRSVNDSTAATELAPREGLPAGLTSWEWNVSPIRDEDGRVAALLSVTRDISDQMMLEQTQKHVQAILDTIPSGVIVVRGPEGRVVQANMRAAQLYGRKPDPGVLFEEHAHQIRLARPDGAPFAPDEMPLTFALTRGETVNNVEARVEHPDGSHVHLMLNAAPLRDEAGEVVVVVGALDDITALKDAEEKLTQAFLHEQRTSRMLQRALLPVQDQFAYIIIDTPPTTGDLLINALVAASQVVIPVETSYLGVSGLRELQRTIEAVRLHFRPDLNIFGYLPTLCDEQRSETLDILGELEQRYPQAVLPPIHKSSDLAYAHSSHMDVFTYRPPRRRSTELISSSSRATQEYEQLVDSILHVTWHLTAGR